MLRTSLALPFFYQSDSASKQKPNGRARDDCCISSPPFFYQSDFATQHTKGRARHVSASLALPFFYQSDFATHQREGQTCFRISSPPFFYQSDFERNFQASARVQTFWGVYFFLFSIFFYFQRREKARGAALFYRTFPLIHDPWKKNRVQNFFGLILFFRGVPKCRLATCQKIVSNFCFPFSFLSKKRQESKRFGVYFFFSPFSSIFKGGRKHGELLCFTALSP